MPELPEVEVQVRGLRKILVNHTIVGVQVIVPNLLSDKMRREVTHKQQEEFQSLVQDTAIISLKRRGKYILIELDNGYTLVSHLKMTGQWIVLEQVKSLPYAAGVVLQLSNNTRVVYRDTRKFGYVILHPTVGLEEFFAHKKLGLEPFSNEFDLALFVQGLKQKSGSTIKAALLSQQVVAGLGNIYVDEACYRASILPTRKINSLTDTEIKQLFLVIEPLLKQAIEAGGSSLTQGTSKVGYRSIEGVSGNFAMQHQVYGRSGKLCYQCGETLLTTTVSSRTTVYCSNCQK
jgi:formamidopyrimidine-DNA glycosylase